MNYLKIIAFLAVLGVALGVNGYLDKQYHVSLFSGLNNTSIGDLTQKLFSKPAGSGTLKTVSFSGNEAANYVPCNSSGACDNKNELCEPVSINNKTELRCVPTAPLEKIPEVGSVSQSKSSGGNQTKSVPTISSLPIADTLSYGKGKVKISGVTPSSFSSGYPSVIYLYASLNQGETLNIDGWQIKTKRTGFFMPRGVEVYEWSGLNTPVPLVLKSGDYVYIYSSDSKIAVNFRPNKCTGYLQTLYSFNPSLPMNCPALYNSRSDIVNLNSLCQNFITSLGSCSIPNTSEPFDPTCRDFLSKIGYATCVANHRNDSDFLSREWRIFLGSGGANRDLVDPSHDRVQLLNKAGTLVDEYIY